MQSNGTVQESFILFYVFCNIDQQRTFAQMMHRPVTHCYNWVQSYMCACSPVPGHHGSVRQFHARLVDITVGVLTVLVIDLIWPW